MVPPLSAMLGFLGLFVATRCQEDGGGWVQCWGSSYVEAVPPDLPPVLWLAGGGNQFECAVLAAGGVRCWGSVGGSGDDISTLSYMDPPSELLHPQSMRCSTNHCCALQDGKVHCWGHNNKGKAAPPSNLPTMAGVSAAHYHTCGWDQNNIVHCWGDSGSSDRFSVDGETGIAKISAGYFHNCMLTTDSFVVCEGAKEAGPYSYGQTIVPANLTEQVDVSTYGKNTCSLSAAGELTCWGDNYHGQLNIPVAASPWRSLDVGSAFVCAQTMDNIVRCWGSSGVQVFDDPLIRSYVSAWSHWCVVYNTTTTTTTTTSSSTVTSSTVTSSTASSSTRTSATWTSSTLTLPTDGGYLVCWGDDSVTAHVPEDLPPVLSIAGGGPNFECVVLLAGGVRCFGTLAFTDADIPAEVVYPQDLRCGSKFCCALQDGKVYCWGDSRKGKTTPPNDLPYMRGISLAADHACGWDKSAVVRCWGDVNNHRRVLDNHPDVQMVAAGYQHNCILTLAGMVECGGDTGSARDYGQFNVPAGLGRQIDLVTLQRHSCSISETNNLTCWGDESNVRAFSTPPPDLGPVKQVSLGQLFTCAQTMDDVIVCWGNFDHRRYGEGLMHWRAGWHHGCAAYKITTTSTTSSTSSTSVTTSSSSSTSATSSSTSTSSSTVTTSSTRTSMTWTSSTLTMEGLGGYVQCWGNAVLVARMPADLPPVLRIAGGAAHFECVVLWAGGVRCWGNVPFTNESIPGEVVFPADLQCGTDYCCALQDGKVYCWGGNRRNKATPPNDLPWMRGISVATFHVCGWDKSAIVHCWGDADANRKIFHGRQNVRKVAAGYVHTCILTWAGVVECDGGTGDRDEGQHDVPGNLAPMIDVVTKQEHSCALSEAQQVRCWGSPGHARGFGDVPSDLPPVKKVALMQASSCAQTVDDELICWGEWRAPANGVGLLDWAVGWDHGCAAFKITTTSTSSTSSSSITSSTSTSSSSSSSSVTSTSTTETSSSTSSSSASTTSSSSTSASSTLTSTVTSTASSSATKTITASSSSSSTSTDTATVSTSSTSTMSTTQSSTSSRTTSGTTTTGTSSSTSSLSSSSSTSVSVSSTTVTQSTSSTSSSSVSTTSSSTSSVSSSTSSSSTSSVSTSITTISSTSSSTVSTSTSATVTWTTSASSTTTVTSTVTSTTSATRTTSSTSRSSTATGTSTTRSRTSTRSSTTTVTSTSSTVSSTSTRTSSTTSVTSTSSTTVTTTSTTGEKDAVLVHVWLRGLDSAKLEARNASAALVLGAAVEAVVSQVAGESGESLRAADVRAAVWANGRNLAGGRSLQASGADAEVLAEVVTSPRPRVSAVSLYLALDGRRSRIAELLRERVAALPDFGEVLGPAFDLDVGYVDLLSQVTTTTTFFTTSTSTTTTIRGETVVLQAVEKEVEKLLEQLSESNETTVTAEIEGATMVSTLLTFDLPLITQAAPPPSGSAGGNSSGGDAAGAGSATAAPTLPPYISVFLPIPEAASPDGDDASPGEGSGGDGGASEPPKRKAPPIEMEVKVPVRVFQKILAEVPPDDGLVMVVTVPDEVKSMGSVRKVGPAERKEKITKITEVKAAVVIDIKTLSGKTVNVTDLQEPIEFNLPSNYSKGMLCAFYDERLESWSFEGVALSENSRENKPILCRTWHLSLFGALFQGFAQALLCSQLTLLNAEAIGQMAKGGWYTSPGGILYWTVLLLMASIFATAAFLDWQRGRHHGWSNSFFLVPRFDGPEENRWRQQAEPPAAEEQGPARPTVTSIASVVEMIREPRHKSYIITAFVRVWLCVTHFCACCKETGFKEALDEIASEYFEQFGETRNMVQGLWEGMEIGALGGGRVFRMGHNVMSRTVLRSARRLAGASMWLHLSVVDFVLEDKMLADLLMMRHEKKIDRERASARLEEERTGSMTEGSRVGPTSSIRRAAEMGVRPSTGTSGTAEGKARKSSVKRPSDDTTVASTAGSRSSARARGSTSSSSASSSEDVRVDGEGFYRESTALSCASQPAGVDFPAAAPVPRPPWWACADREEAWAILHDEVCEHMTTHVTKHTWCRVPHMVWNIFSLYNPLGSVFAVSIFMNCKMRALFLMLKLTGDLLVVCIFYQASGLVTDHESDAECGDEELEEEVSYKTGRVLAIAMGSVLLAGLPVTLLESLHTRSLKKFDYEGCPEWKRQLRAWALQDAAIWLIGLLYMTFGVFFVALFLANVNADDHEEWTIQGCVSLVQDALLLPLGVAVTMPVLGGMLLSFVGRFGRVERHTLIRDIHHSLHSDTNVMLPIVSL